ncbi:hypothetical protein IJJ54_01360 [Candidatus Saccharibacteria bacterium]|nr:hypothetical protein [Candidatus Saccharibacteria bacterium]
MRTTKLASYLLATAVMAVSPFTAFATEGSGTAPTVSPFTITSPPKRTRIP